MAPSFKYFYEIQERMKKTMADKTNETTTKELFSVWAPEVPGATQSIVAICETIEQARSVCGRYANRRDLKGQDVCIRSGRDGIIVEGDMGPCR